MNDDNLVDYYRKRASEYEKIYFQADSEFREENRNLGNVLKNLFSVRRVIEIACGTGYWTQFVAETAKSIVATDLVPEVLTIARKKTYKCPTVFDIEDAYHLSYSENVFTGGFATFWFSHIPKNRIDQFITGFHRVLQRGAKVCFADNVLIKKDEKTLIMKPNDENTYKLRYLKDKSEHIITKNYYTPDQLVNIFKKHTNDFTYENIHIGNRIWYVKYDL
ncbi:MAG: class I SAM-dependent methyltransferase [Candidatus Kariarchaeaceae archaeon]|jgi:ubiquinone/menaquinone biosynthesis C-methylase UbiE